MNYFKEEFELKEAPLQIGSFNKAETQNNVEGLWDMYKDEGVKKIGTLSTEAIFAYETTFKKTLFLVANNKPTFYITLDRLLSPHGFGIEFAIKNKSRVKYEDLLMFIIKRYRPVWSGYEQTKESMSVWKKLVSNPALSVMYYDVKKKEKTPIAPDDLWSNKNIAIGIQPKA